MKFLERRVVHENSKVTLSVHWKAARNGNVPPVQLEYTPTNRCPTDDTVQTLRTAKTSENIPYRKRHSSHLKEQYHIYAEEPSKCHDLNKLNWWNDESQRRGSVLWVLPWTMYAHRFYASYVETKPNRISFAHREQYILCLILLGLPPLGQECSDHDTEIGEATNFNAEWRI